MFKISLMQSEICSTFILQNKTFDGISDGVLIQKHITNNCSELSESTYQRSIFKVQLYSMGLVGIEIHMILRSAN